MPPPNPAAPPPVTGPPQSSVPKDNTFRDGETITVPVEFKTAFDQVAKEIDELSKRAAQPGIAQQQYLEAVSQSEERLKALQENLEVFNKKTKEGGELQKQINATLKETADLQAKISQHVKDQTVDIKAQKKEQQELLDINTQVQGVGEHLQTQPTGKLQSIRNKAQEMDIPEATQQAKEEAKQTGIAKLPNEGILGKIKDIAQGGGKLEEAGAAGKILSKIPGMEAAGPMVAEAAPYVGAAVAAYSAVTDRLRSAQEYTKITGGTSVAQASQYDIQARVMAMSPFLTDQQAREVIQGTLNAGYRGDKAQTVMDFVAKNMKDGVFDVNTSIGMFRKVVDESGGSVDALSANIEGLRKTAASGGESLGDLSQQFSQHVDQLSKMGAGPNVPELASLFTGTFAGNKALHGQQYNPLGTPYGQFLASQQLGVPMNMLPSAMHALGQLPVGQRDAAMQKLYTGTQESIKGRLNSFLGGGLKEGMTADQIWRQFPDRIQMLPGMLNQLGIQVAPDDYNRAVDILAELYKPQGGPAGQHIRDLQNQGAIHRAGIGAREVSNLQAEFNRFNPAARSNWSLSAATRSRTSLESTYEKDVANHGLEMPLVSQLLSTANNVRDIRVGGPGVDKVMPLSDYIKKYGHQGLINLQHEANSKGQAIQIEDIKAGPQGQGHHTWQTLSQFEGRPSPNANRNARAAAQAGDQTGNAQGTIELGPIAQKYFQLVDPGTGTVDDSLQNILTAGNARRGTQNSSDILPHTGH